MSYGSVLGPPLTPPPPSASASADVAYSTAAAHWHERVIVSSFGPLVGLVMHVEVQSGSAPCVSLYSVTPTVVPSALVTVLVLVAVGAKSSSLAQSSYAWPICGRMTDGAWREVRGAWCGE